MIDYWGVWVAKAEDWAMTGDGAVIAYPNMAVLRAHFIRDGLPEGWAFAHIGEDGRPDYFVGDGVVEHGKQ